MSASFVVRPMERGDVPRVLAIARASLPEAWTLEGFESEVDAPASLALVLGAPVSGYAVGRCVLDEMELLSIAVDPADRRSGAGRALLAALLSGAVQRGVRTVHLEVRHDNAAAIALYRAAGFTSTGTRARYYADGTDARLMAWARAT